MRGLLLTLLLAGCAMSEADEGMRMSGTRAERFPFGDGRDGWTINCDGAANSIANCYRRAQAVCPNGFTPVDRSEHPNGGAVVASPAGATVVQGVSRTLTVVCNS